jgi:hypothetical protein
MAKFLSDRQPSLRVGISSYTEDKTVLQTTGRVGIGTTQASSILSVFGDVAITGVVTATTINGNVNSGVGTITTLSSTNATVTNLSGTISTITTLNSTNSTVTNLNGTNLNYVGFGTIQTFGSTNATITNLNTVNGSVTNSSGTNLNYSGIGTVVTLQSQTGTVTNLTGTAATITSLNSTNGTVTNLTGTAATIATLNSTNGTVTNLSSTNGTVTNLTGTAATIATLNSTNGTVTNLNATIGNITNTNGTNLSYNGIGTITNVNTTNGSIVNLSGTIGTITTFNSTTSTITNSNGTNLNYSGVSTATNLRGTNVSYTGVGTITTFNSTAASITNIGGNNLNYNGIGTIATLNSSVSTITTLNSTNGTVTNLSGTIGTVTTLNSTVGVITNTRGTNLNYTGIGTITTLDVTNGNLSNLSGTLGTVTNFNSTTATITSLNATNSSFTNINSSGISTLGVATVANLNAQRLNVSGISTLTQISAGGTTGVNQYVLISTGTGLSWQPVTSVGATTGVSITNDTSTTSAQYLLFTDATSGVVSNEKVSSTKLTYIASSGSLGIGTTNPTQSLDINGNARFRSGIFDNNNSSGNQNYVLASNGTGGVVWQPVTAIGSTNGISITDDTTTNAVRYLTFTSATSGLITNENVASTKLTYNPSSGNLGLSSVTPTSRLSVEGDARVSGVVTASQLSTGASGSGVNITSNTISGPSTLYIDPAGVGDNTGAVRIYGDLYVDGTQFVVNSTTIELADFNVGIASTVGTNSILDGAGIGIGSANIRKTITWSNSSSALKSSENFDIASGKTYKVNGTDVLSSTSLGSNVTSSSLTSVGTLGQLNVSGVSTLTQISAGGTTGPNQYVLASTGTGLSWQPVTSVGATTGVVITDDTTTNATRYLLFTNATSGVINTENVSSTKLTYNPLTGNIGISSVTPTSRLSVEGDARISGVVTATTFSGNLSGTASFATSAGVSTNIKGGSQGSVPYQSAVDTTALLSPGTAGHVLITNGPGQNPYWGPVSAASGTFGGISVRDEGNVVGTSGSVATLDFRGANIVATATTGASGIATITILDTLVGTSLSITGVSTFTNGPILIGAGTSTGVSDQKLQVTGGAYVSGNIGIGITTPTQPLDINGNIRLRSGLFDNNNISGFANYVLAANGAGGVTWQSITAIGATTGVSITEDSSTATPQYLLFTSATSGVVPGGKVSSTKLTYVASSGSLGIGTTNPSQSLDINGSVRLRGSFYDNTNSIGNANYVLSSNGTGGVTWQPVTSIGATSGVVISDDTTTNATRYLLFTSSTSGVVTTENVSSTKLTYNPSTGNIGISSVTPTSKLSVEGDARISGVVTATTFSGQVNSGVGTITTLGATTATLTTLNSTNATLTNINSSGISTLGITTTTSLTVQRLNVSGVSTFSQISAGGTTGVNQYVLTSTGTGLSWQPVTSVGGGLLSGIVVQDDGSIVGTAGSITTLNFGTNISATAVALGLTATVNVSNTPSFDTLNVAGLSTFTSGPVLIGSGTSTGTFDQKLQVTGGAYVSGNLGLGVAAPTQPLDVSGNVRLRSGLFDNNNSSGLSNYVLSANGSGGVTWQPLTSIGSTLGVAIADDTTTNATRYLMFTSVNAGIITTGNVSSTKLTYNPSTGNLGISSVTPSSRLSVSGDAFISGVTTSTDFNSSSDINLKKDIIEIKNPLATVESLHGVKFTWKSDDKKSIGVIAQELEEVLPELVSKSEIKSVNYNGIIAVLIEAVKELSAEVKELKQKLNN